MSELLRGESGRNFRRLAAVVSTGVLSLGSIELPSAEASGPNRHLVFVSSLVSQSDTGFYLKKGQRYRASYKGGEWSVDRINFPYVGPEGYMPDQDSNIYQGCKIIPQEPYGEMLGFIGNSITAIGDGGTFKAQTSGELLLGINDKPECLWDNGDLAKVPLAMSVEKLKRRRK